MKPGDNLFVRVDRRNDNSKMSNADFEEHINYLEKIAAERYFIGGGFTNVPGGMIIFEAKDMEDARLITDNDPLIKSNLYTYDIYEWKLVIISREIDK